MSSLRELAQSAKNLANDIVHSANPWISTDEAIPACYKTLNLIEIPGIMQKTGCFVGAALMNRWFRGSSYTLSDDQKSADPLAHLRSASAIESKIVTMQWALNYTRTFNVYSELRDIVEGRNRISFLASQDLLFKRLSRFNKIGKTETTFGESWLSTFQRHQELSINSRQVSATLKAQALDPTDDLYCALGAFGIHLTASGKVKPVNKGGATHEVHIEKFGYFIRDTYDFNGSQPLGFWSYDGVTKTPRIGSSYVDNGSFQQWRNKHNKGGDFIVYSDVKWQVLRTPLVLNYPY